MPAVGTRQPISIQYRDYSGETKSIRLYAGELTAVSLPGFLTQLAALESALDAVTIGRRAATSYGAETILSNERAVAKAAQIETELLVRVQGATTERPWSFRIPTVDYNTFAFADPPAGDTVIISGAGADSRTTALITALEALVKMPDDDTEGVVVVGMNVV